MAFKPVRTTPPADPPVSTEEAKAHLRVTHSDDDALIDAYVEAAVSHLDGHAGVLGRCMVSQTWRQDFEGWPAKGLLRLPLCDVSGISSVKYSDANGTEQTLPSNQYALGEDERSSFVWFKSAFTSPSLDSDRPDPVRVEFVAGFGDPDDVPAALKHAIKLMLADFYENREDTVVGSGLDVRPLPRGVDALIYPYRRVGL